MPYNHIKDESSLKLANRKTFDKNTLVLIYSQFCGPCHMFLPIWAEFVNMLKNKNNDMHVCAIESSFLNKVTNKQLASITGKMMINYPYVPNISKFNSKTNRIYMFNKDKTLRNLSLFFK
jgi:thiol-disulfide isomerase/thioredoxin